MGLYLLPQSYVWLITGNKKSQTLADDTTAIALKLRYHDP
jgi:hypothetical protein